MQDIIPIAVGITLLIFGYLIGIKKKIRLVHSYHYKRVAEQDKPAFCRGVGLGNAIIGLAALLVPVLTRLIGEDTALIIAAVAAVIALVIVFFTIIRYNRGLF
ncbi:MAG: DUF3784 domain-containing protein [Oscillospiraceae bacterium]